MDDTILGLVFGLSGMMLGWLSWLRSRKKDSEAETGQSIAFRVDLEYIKRGVDDIRADQRRLRNEMGTMADRLARVEESAKSAHKRLDEYAGTHPADR